MSCVRTPTSTRYGTATLTSLSASATISNELSWVTSTNIVSVTSCLAYATPTPGSSTTASPQCVSSTVSTSISYTNVQTSIPHTIATDVPVLVPQVTPIETLWSECPDDPNPPPDTNTDPTSTSRRSTAITTYTSVITLSGGSIWVSTMTSATGINTPPGDGTRKSSSNLPAIIGGAVGGIIAVAAIIGLVWYILRRREQLKDLLEEDEDDDNTLHGPKAVGLLLRDGKRGRRSVNLEAELKDSRPYQYGVVGSGPSPSVSPIPHSQYSSMGGYSHRRDGSRDALMRSRGPSSPPGSPGRLDAHLPPGQGTSLYSGPPESIMMTATQPLINPHTQPGEDAWPGGQRPQPSIMDSAIVYPPGHGGFYQQYGPMEPAHSPTTVSSPSTAFGSQPPPVVPITRTSMHKPSLEPTLASATQPLPTHQALIAAAGLSDSQIASTSRVTVSPPPGAAGARPYTERRETTDMLSAVMASGDQAASSIRPDEVGFGRQRPSEKSPRRETIRSPIIQHQDGGRVPESAANATPNTNINDSAEAPPPAYSQS